MVNVDNLTRRQPAALIPKVIFLGHCGYQKPFKGRYSCNFDSCMQAFHLKYLSPVLGLFLGLALESNAQINDTLDRIEKVEVVTKYEPVLSNARKLDVYPEIEEPEQSPPVYSYDLPSFRYAIEPMFKPSEPSKLKNKTDRDALNNITKIGIGNYWTPLVDAHLHNGSSEKYSYGAQIRHLSSRGTPENADFSDNYLGLYGTQFQRKYRLNGKLNYERNRFNYYGYDHDSFSFNSDTLKQVFNQVHAHVELDNYPSTKKVGNKAGIYFYHFGNASWLDFDLAFKDELSMKFRKSQFKLHASYRFNQTSLDSTNYVRNFIGLNPTYQFEIKKFQMDAGLRFTLFLDSADQNTFINPYVQVVYPLVKNRMNAFMGLDGGLQVNSLQSLSLQNQFINGRPELRNSFTKYKVYGGVKGNLYGKLDYVLSFDQGAIENLPMFLADSNDITSFLVVYDDRASVFTFHSAFAFRPTSSIESGLAFNYYTYNLSSEPQAWHLPDFDLSLNILARIGEKLKVHTKLFALGSRTAGFLERPSATSDLPVFVDFNAGADYQYSKKMAFFVNVNNITASRYQRWVNYPVFGINALAGLTITL